MALRMIVDLGDRVLQFALKEGSYLIGSEPSCDLPLSHPTVSRRHARLTIAPEENLLEDTGSSNGTWINGGRISEPSVLKPGDTLRFGNVVARIEAIDLSDIEAGISIPFDEEGAKAEIPAPTEGRTTIGPAVLESFSLQRLPELTRILASGASRVEVAQAVGAAVFSGLPCNRVEIGRNEEKADALLFSARHQGPEDGFENQGDLGEGEVIRVRFLTEALAKRYAPLIEVAAALIRCAGRREIGTPTPSGPEREPLEPPKPISLVPEVTDIYSRAGRIAQSPVSILIQGESGTGKELLARFIHAASDRAEAPLVTLNCAALPRDLLESELFGVEQGVATGVRARPGRFETADGGTLFLDEIGDMAPETQARILRVLQEKEVYRVGGTKALSADVRVISATNRDLNTMLSEGSFRRDLYHRIADWVVELPPLRERKPDIPNLAVHFLARACRKRGVRPRGISRAALEILKSYEWPGNVRQLEKEMGRAALFVEDGGMLDTSCLQPAIRGEHPATSGEAYGVIGSSASPEGAGMAAINTNGGADLVLDGSVDGETDTRLWEWGLDRASSSDEAFLLNNSGAGKLNLTVAGAVTADGFTGDGSGLSGVAADDLDCVGCIQSADIADGGVDTADLAAAAVRGPKLAAGTVGASTIRSNAVMNSHLADDAVTSAEILDGTITAADLRGGGLYSSKDQLYERVESALVDPTFPGDVTAACDDENDLALAGSCSAPGSGFLVKSFQSQNWGSLVYPSGWECQFKNTSTTQYYTGTARILCISVPGH